MGVQSGKATPQKNPLKSLCERAMRKTDFLSQACRVSFHGRLRRSGLPHVSCGILEEADHYVSKKAWGSTYSFWTRCLSTMKGQAAEHHPPSLPPLYTTVILLSEDSARRRGMQLCIIVIGQMLKPCTCLWGGIPPPWMPYVPLRNFQKCHACRIIERDKVRHIRKKEKQQSCRGREEEEPQRLILHAAGNMGNCIAVTRSTLSWRDLPRIPCSHDGT